jgi:diacylglycerol O-acyltransferase / wax synthase
MVELRFDKKMSDAEALMWRLEKDPYLSSGFANLSILDRPPEMDRLRRRFDRTTRVVPRLRQRVQPMPANLSAPIWVDDPNFDLAYHLRHIALPKPGTVRQLLDLTTLIAADQFDRTRPLWQFYVIDGLRGGKSALVAKLHHTIVDGEAGVQLALEYLDFERDAPGPAPLADGPQPPAGEHAGPSGTTADTLRELLSGGLRVPAALARQVRDLLADPRQLPEAGTAAAETLRGVVSQLSETDSAKSPLWTTRSLRRHLEVVQAPFAATRDAARHFGGTLNHAFVAAAADAAGRYHAQRGHPVEALRASMVVSTRTASSGANAFSLARLLVPTGEMPMAERFAAIRDRSANARANTATAGMEALAALASALPTSVITRLARQQSQTVDFATSNVRGTPVPVFVAGAEVLANYPIGPMAGVAFNLTLLSHVGSLDMGLHMDADAIDDPALLRRCLERAFKELGALAP